MEEAVQACPQVALHTHHTLHGGVYTRTVRIPAGVIIVGALIKIPTTVIVSGDCLVTTDGEIMGLDGYGVLRASAGRKQVFRALTNTYLTMLFRTDAQTVEDAEAEFTDEAESLLSRREGASNSMAITGGV